MRTLRALYGGSSHVTGDGPRAITSRRTGTSASSTECHGPRDLPRTSRGHSFPARFRPGFADHSLASQRPADASTSREARGRRSRMEQERRHAIPNTAHQRGAGAGGCSFRDRVRPGSSTLAVHGGTVSPGEGHPQTAPPSRGSRSQPQGAFASSSPRSQAAPTRRRRGQRQDASRRAGCGCNPPALASPESEPAVTRRLEPGPRRLEFGPFRCRLDVQCPRQTSTCRPHCRDDPRSRTRSHMPRCPPDLHRRRTPRPIRLRLRLQTGSPSLSI